MTVKLNVDGASSGNPGPAGVGCRNASGGFEFVYSSNIGIATNFIAECTTIQEGIETALNRGKTAIWVESDSTTAVAAFNFDKIPWQLKGRWR
ncbi:hypothetical protein IFM89_012562 [Coptis chinensis]|uniref:RNase H type-1 domain-containing protein n=1 Tax=Coptis chinensis TaxID=261450 RepID=A0A835LE32_9MAGN|nr:hypothetical protein IFM89_012562 [Coptis chinensis]